MHHLSQQGSVQSYVVSSESGWKEEKEKGEFDLDFKVLTTARMARRRAQNG